MYNDKYKVSQVYMTVTFPSDNCQVNKWKLLTHIANKHTPAPSVLRLDLLLFDSIPLYHG